MSNLTIEQLCDIARLILASDRISESNRELLKQIVDEFERRW